MIQNSSTSKLESKSVFRTIFLVSLVSIIPFFVFLFFTSPCSDDIFYHNYSKNKTIWGFLSHHYNTWTGRYFSNLMMAINPYTLTSNPQFYPVMMLVLFLFFLVSLYFLFSSISKSLTRPSRENSHYNAIYLTIITLSLFLHKMPRVTDTFFWFAGASSHLLPIAFVLISIGLYIRYLSADPNQKNNFSMFFISLTSVITCGSNETLAIQWIFILGFAIFYRKLIFLKWEKFLIFPFIVATVCFLFLFFAPGNAIRAKELTGGHSIILLIYKPLGLILETTFRYLSLAMISLVVFSYPKLKELNFGFSETLKSRKSRIWLYLFGFGIFGLTFVPSVWTMGSLPPHRVLNNSYLFFILYGTFLILISAHKMDFLERWSAKIPIKILTVIFSLSLLSLFNNYYAWKDLINLPSFFKSLQKRELILASGQNSDLAIEPLPYFPTTFFYEDISTNPGDYRNIVVAEFYKLKSVRLSKDYDKEAR